MSKIGILIDKYRTRHNGIYPKDIEELSEIGRVFLACPMILDNGKPVAYIYRCGDVDFKTSENLIIAYDSIPIHNGLRNVLFSNPTKIFQVNGISVSDEEFEDACVKLLSENYADVQIELYEKHRLKETYNISALNQDSFVKVSDIILNDYLHDKSKTKSIRFLRHSRERQLYEVIASLTLVRVKSLSETEFEDAIKHDNKLRMYLGLSEKPI